jgi:hypothetical protein
MPYFKNNNINLLFIHIPKTGGTSLEKYFSSKYNIPLNNDSLFGQNKKFNVNVHAYLQHILYKTVINYKSNFKIDTNNLEIITIVRNPYNKIISDLFNFKLIKVNSTPLEVYEAIKKFIKLDNKTVDNHNIPQNLFIRDSNDQILSNIKILHTETLNNDMKNLGYSDFDIYENKNKNKITNYMNYLNNAAIKVINYCYHDDFVLFNYNIINT